MLNYSGYGFYYWLYVNWMEKENVAKSKVQRK